MKEAGRRERCRPARLYRQGEAMRLFRAYSVVDGYQASREIRKMERFNSLPIIAVTAKAMPGDRERSIEAGASDYIPKPVDPARLLSLLRVWLYPKQ